MELFELRGKVSKTEQIAFGILGALILLALWHCLPSYGFVSDRILPPPADVLKSYGDMYAKDDLVKNMIFSIKLNTLGYVEAIIVSLSLGFLIGLFPLFRSMFGKPVSALRFTPLSAMTGIFIAWFGIYLNMKVQFLAFGIIVYMLPTVIQRIDEVQQVYVDTVYTLGANKWQTIRTVFLPDVLARFIDDIRVLTAISWTYIIIAELVNRTEGGLGALAFLGARQSRIDKVFAILLLIIMIGMVQDLLFKLADRLLFRFKHA